MWSSSFFFFPQSCEIVLCWVWDMQRFHWWPANWESVLLCCRCELGWLLDSHSVQIRCKLGTVLIQSSSSVSVFLSIFFLYCTMSLTLWGFSLFLSFCPLFLLSMLSLPGWNHCCEASRKGLSCKPECSLAVSGCVFLSLVRCTQGPAGSPEQSVQLESGREDRHRFPACTFLHMDWHKICFLQSVTATYCKKGHFSQLCGPKLKLYSPWSAAGHTLTTLT